MARHLTMMTQKKFPRVLINYAIGVLSASITMSLSAQEQSTQPTVSELYAEMTDACPLLTAFAIE